MELSSHKNLSSAFGGINLIATLPLDCMVTMLTCMITLKLDNNLPKDQLLKDQLQMISVDQLVEVVFQVLHTQLQDSPNVHNQHSKVQTLHLVKDTHLDLLLQLKDTHPDHLPQVVIQVVQLVDIHPLKVVIQVLKAQPDLIQDQLPFHQMCHHHHTQLQLHKDSLPKPTMVIHLEHHKHQQENIFRQDKVKKSLNHSHINFIYSPVKLPQKIKQTIK